MTDDLEKMLTRRPDETERQYFDRVIAWATGADVRSKTDLRDFTGSPTFHLDNEHKKKR